MVPSSAFESLCRASFRWTEQADAFVHINDVRAFYYQATGVLIVEFSPTDVRPSVFYQHMIHTIVPRPIAWVSTRSATGIKNAAPFSYFTGVGSRPPTLLFCPANNRQGNPKDTLRNIQATGDFVVNVVTRQTAESMSASSAEFPPEESEFEHCGITATDSKMVTAPGIAESPVRFECTCRQILNIGTGPGGANIVVGNVVHVFIDDRVLGPNGLADPELLDAIGRMGGTEYCLTRDRFDLPRPN